LFEVEIRHGLLERKDGMRGIVVRADQSLLLAEPGDKCDGPAWFNSSAREHCRSLYYSRYSARIIIRAIVDSIAVVAGLHAQVIVMSAEDHDLIA
jgi:hypothetical protein